MSNTQRSAWLPAVLLLAVAAVIGLACGSSGDDKAKITSTPAAGQAAATTAAGTQAAATTTGTQPAQVRTANIGAVLSLNGAGGVYGKTQKNGIELALAEINDKNAVPGVKLNVTFEDDNSTQPQGITAFNKLLNANVLTIIGPTLSNTAQATDPIAQDKKVPVLGVSNTLAGLTDIGDYIFRDSLTEADVIPQTVKKVKDKLSPKKAALLFANDDAFSKAGGDVMREALKANGIEIATEQQFSTKDTDFRSILTNVKSANPDVLFVSALNDPVVGIVTQARDLGLKQTIVGGNGFNTPALTQQAGEAAEGIIVGAAWNGASTNPKSQEFIKNYKAKYNSDPDQFAAQAYAGVYILAEAIRKAEKPDTLSIRDALAKIQDFDTVLGKFSFNAKRDAAHPAVVQIVKGGKLTVYE